MRCKSPWCEKEALPDRWYCSRECAPYGHYLGASPIKSANRMGKSTLKARGDRLAVSSVSEAELPTNEKLIPEKRLESTEPRKKPITAITRGPKPNIEPGGTLNPSGGEEPNHRSEWNTKIKILNIEEGKRERIMESTEMTDCVGYTKQGVKETQPQQSQNSLINVEGTKSDTLLLLKESTSFLYELMKSNKDKPLVACHCASEIHKLVRLKLDVLREARIAQRTSY